MTWPTDMDNHLIFFSEEDMSWLQGSEIVKFAEQTRKKLQHDYSLISENIPGFSDEYS